MTPMSKAEPSGGSATMAHIEPAENQIVVYQPNETVRLDVRLENETVWLTPRCRIRVKEGNRSEG